MTIRRKCGTCGCWGCIVADVEAVQWRWCGAAAAADGDGDDDDARAAVDEEVAALTQRAVVRPLSISFCSSCNCVGILDGG